MLMSRRSLLLSATLTWIALLPASALADDPEIDHSDSATGDSLKFEAYGIYQLNGATFQGVRLYYRKKGLSGWTFTSLISGTSEGVSFPKEVTVGSAGTYEIKWKLWYTDPVGNTEGSISEVEVDP